MLWKTLSRKRDHDRLRERVLALRADDLRRWGTMSVGEMVCHVRGAFRMAAGDVAVEPVRAPLPGGVLKLLALRLPKAWPEGVPTVAELERGTAAMQPGQFEEDRAGLLEAMERLAGLRENRRAHPIFGPMRPGDWMRWGYLHTDHHLRQFGR